MRRLGWRAAVVVIAAGVLIACETDDGNDDDTAVTTEEEEDPTVDPEGEEPETGSAEEPLPAGTELALENWTVVLGETVTDATEQVLEENELNDPPVEGRQFVMAPVTATYVGEESGDAFFELNFLFLGSGGNTFGTAGDDFCGVIPDDLAEQGEVFPEAEVNGNVCVSVPSDQVDGGAWIVEDLVAAEERRYFVAVG